MLENKKKSNFEKKLLLHNSARKRCYVRIKKAF